MLSEPDFFELCTPVIFGSLEAAEEAIKAVEPEQKMSFNVLKDIKASIDGRINLVDNLESEKDAISIAVNAYLDNCIDAVVIITNEIYNTPEKPKLTALIAEAMQHENSDSWIGFVMASTKHLTLPLSQILQQSRNPFVGTTY